MSCKPQPTVQSYDTGQRVQPRPQGAFLWLCRWGGKRPWHRPADPLFWLVDWFRKWPHENNLSLYRKIEMAESMSTPTKISARNPVRRLCGGSQESRYVLWIFSKAGSSKDLCSQVYKSCGIKISEDDTRLAVLCRSCVTFVDKMDQFIRTAQSVDSTPSYLNSKYSVKRYVQLSPTSHQPSKRLQVSKDMPTESFDVDEPQYKGLVGLHDFSLTPKCRSFQ